MNRIARFGRGLPRFADEAMGNPWFHLAECVCQSCGGIVFAFEIFL